MQSYIPLPRIEFHIKMNSMISHYSHCSPALAAFDMLFDVPINKVV